MGGIYTGVLKANGDRAPDRSRLQGIYEIPRAERSSSALASPSTYATRLSVPVFGEIDPSALCQLTTILVGRKPVDIEITYLGPLPR